MIRHCCTIAGVIVLGIATTLGAVGLAAAGGDEPKSTRGSDDPKSAVLAKSDDRAKREESPLAQKLDLLKDQYDDASRALGELLRGSTIPEENLKRAAEIRPDFSAVVRRISELGATAPKDLSVRNAMLWVLERAQGNRPEGTEFSLAANWLVRHFGDDPDAVRVGLQLDNWPNFERDNLIMCFYASAKSRESKGLARLALAQYLEKKAMMADGARKVESRPTYIHDDLERADGTLYTEKEVQPDDEYAYLLQLKQCDVAYVRAEAERLYHEVIAEYADVPYITARVRTLERLLKQPEPKRNGKRLTDEEQRKMAAGIARRRSTLGEVAEARLDDLYNLAVGKPAPDINGTDFEGKPLMLSNYRGKVVALVFWGTWCGPCMRDVPGEKALLERMKGRPFAMLGVNVDADANVARKVMEEQGIAWPNWHDGAPGEGPITKLYHVRGYPTVYVIDAEGKIRSKKAHGDGRNQLVEKLVAEREAAGR